MNILVCLKQIPDPEIPARDFRIASGRREAERGSANLITNIFCENALETALQFRDRGNDAKITAVTYGAASAEDSLRKALAMRADAAVLIANDGNANPDPLSVARVLAAAARKLGSFDLILTGRESGDWGAGQTGALLAEELGWPCIAFADEIDRAGEKLRVRRQTERGWEMFEAEPPLVLTITNQEHNVPRIPKVRDVMTAHRQPLATLSVDELSIDAASARAGNGYYEVSDLFIPQTETRCEFVAGDTLEQKVDAFARKLVGVTSAL